MFEVRSFLFLTFSFFCGFANATCHWEALDARGLEGQYNPRHFNEAVLRMAMGKPYDAVIAEQENRRGEEVLESFSSVTRHWDLFIPLFIERLKEVSSGDAVLREASADEIHNRIKGRAHYLHLTRQTVGGPLENLVAITQSGTDVGPLPVPVAKTTEATPVTPPPASKPAKKAITWIAPREHSQYGRIYENAAAALAEGKDYNAGDSDDPGVFQAFIQASQSWDVFVPQLIQRVQEVSGGKTTLEPVDAKEARIGIMGLARYFRLTRQTDQGPVSRYFYLGQNGLGH